MKFRIGDTVKLLRVVTARYSGYSGRPTYDVPAGTLCTIKSGPHPAVRGNKTFYNATLPGWGDGISLFAGDAEKLRNPPGCASLRGVAGIVGDDNTTKGDERG